MGAVTGLTKDTPLQILFTSGTTGDPKGVVITHGNVLASVVPIEDGAQPYMRYERLIHPLRILHTLPLSHVFGQTMGLWVPPIFRAECISRAGSPPRTSSSSSARAHLGSGCRAARSGPAQGPSGSEPSGPGRTRRALAKTQTVAPLVALPCRASRIRFQVLGLRLRRRRAAWAA
jgi:hypothetical protein